MKKIKNKLHAEEFHKLDKRSQWLIIKRKIRVKKKLRISGRSANEIHGLLMKMPPSIRSWLERSVNIMSGDDKDIEELFRVSTEEVQKRVDAINIEIKILKKIFYKGLDDELRKQLNESRR